MASKKRRHSPLKRMQRQLNDLRLWSWESDFDKDGVRYAELEVRLHPLLPYRTLSEQMFLSDLVRHPFNWKVCARVLCQSGDDVWLETRELIARQTKINGLSSIYQAMKEDAISSQQRGQIIDVGWIAHTFGKNPDKDESWIYAHQGEVTEARKMLYRLSLANEKQEAA